VELMNIWPAQIVEEYVYSKVIVIVANTVGEPFQIHATLMSYQLILPQMVLKQALQIQPLPRQHILHLEQIFVAEVTKKTLEVIVEKFVFTTVIVKVTSIVGVLFPICVI